MPVKFSNNAATFIIGNITDTDTSITVDNVSGFPALTAVDYFYATLQEDSFHEIIKVTDVTGDVLTCERGVDGTAALAFTSGSALEIRVNTAMLADSFSEASIQNVDIDYLEETATGGETYVDTSFTLAQDTKNIACFVNGYKKPDSELTRTSDTRLSFSTPLNNGDIVEVRSMSFKPTAVGEAIAAANASSVSAIAAQLAETNAETAETNAAASAVDAEASANNIVVNYHEEEATGGETYTDTPFVLASDLDNIACFVNGHKEPKSRLTRTSDTRLTFGEEVPVDSQCGALYTDDINLNWGGGSLLGTALNGAVITGNSLDLTGAVSGRGLTYSGSGNIDNAQIGCIRLKVNLNYSGIPATAQYFISTTRTGVSSWISIYHYTNGYVRAIAYDDSGSLIGESLFYWNTPVAGTTYEFEFNYDFTAGASRFFIDGVQKGSTITGTGTRSTSVDFKIGQFYGGAQSPDFFLENIIVFDAVQHTANYTPNPTFPYELAKSDIVEVRSTSFSPTATGEAAASASAAALSAIAASDSATDAETAQVAAETAAGSVDNFQRHVTITADSVNSIFDIGIVLPTVVDAVFLSSVQSKFSVAFTGNSVAGIKITDGTNTLVTSGILNIIDTVYEQDASGSTIDIKGKVLKAEFVEADGVTPAIPTAGNVKIIAKG
ncbi:MAG: hypothetical protein U9O94_06045 [Nanoarchaeota archaeon]|nr:hypothetical protein [Nanoarchaeota archaeon]